MLFKEVAGVNDVKDKLRFAIDGNHVAHAQLFFGPEGSAKLGLALAYITYLNCLQPIDNDACGTCSSCHKMSKWIHPDVHFIFPTAGAKKESDKPQLLKEWRKFLLEMPYSNLSDWAAFCAAENKGMSIGVEESRAVMKLMHLKAFEAKYKSVIIWYPELMNSSASNALLKILEEPAPKTIFILISQNPDQLLLTIKSRVQALFIRPYEDDEVYDFISQDLSIVNSRLPQIVRLAEGNLNLALALAQEVEDDKQKIFRDWMLFSYKNDFINLSKYSDTFNSLGKESQKNVINYGLSIIRMCLLVKYSEQVNESLKEGEKDFISKFSAFVHLKNIDIIIEKLNEFQNVLARNANTKIAFFHCSVQLGKALRLPKE